MRNCIATILLLVATYFVMAQEGVSFRRNQALSALISEAKRDNKYIFLDCFTTWCVPCKEMDKYVFASTKVGTFVNERFIAAKLQMDSSRLDDELTRQLYGEAKTVKEKYDVNAFPTYLFFDPNGNIVHKGTGRRSEDEFIAIAEAALHRETQFFSLMTAYNDGSASQAMLYQLAKSLKELSQDSFSVVVADNYISSLTHDQLFEKKNIELINEFTQNSQTRGFQFFYNNAKRVNAVMGKEGYVDNLLMNIMIKESPGIKKLSEAKQNLPLWDNIYLEIEKKYKGYYAQLITIWLKVPYYKQREDWPNYTKSLLPFIDRFGKNIHAVFLNNYAWDIFLHSNEQQELLAASQWVYRILQEEKNDATYIDTYANLLYKLGNKSEAIEWETRAVQLEPENRAFRDVLEKMKEGVEHKRPLSIADGDSWEKIDERSLVLSDDGKFVAFELGSVTGGTSVIIKSVFDGKQVCINDGHDLQFADNRNAVFSIHDSLGIVSLPEFKMKYFPRVTARLVTLKDVGGNSRILFSSVSKVLADNSTLLINLDLNAMRMDTFHLGTEVSNFTFDRVGDQLIYLRKVQKNRENGFEMVYLNIRSGRATVKHTTINYRHAQLVLANGPMRWSPDGKKVFFTMQEKETTAGAVNDVGYSSTVNVWGYRDEILQSQQRATAEAPSNWNAVLNLITNSIVVLTSPVENENLGEWEMGNGEWVLIYSGYNPAEMHWNKNARPTWSVVSSAVPGRKLTVEKHLLGYNDAVKSSPSGNYVIYYDREKRSYFAFDICTETTRNVSRNIQTKLFDEDFDEPGPAPNYGIAAWIKNDERFMVYDKYDIWIVDPAGNTPPVNITRFAGRKSNTVFRIVPAFEQYGSVPVVNCSDTLLLAAFNLSNKYNGFYTVVLKSNVAPQKKVMSPHIYYLPQLSVSSAVSASVPPLRSRVSGDYVLLRSSSAEAPALYHTSDFKQFKQLFSAQPQKQFNWLTTELHTWATNGALTNRGIIYKPENFNPHRKYPVIIYFYERKSDGLNKFMSPGPSDGTLNIPFFVSNGYVVFTPDVVYQPGFPGQSVHKAISDATKHLIKYNWVDTKRIGLHGHSWGAYGVNYIITKSNRFAAACEAAGPVNFISGYLSLRGDGSSRQFLYENGQSRIGKTLWEQKNLYILNSPVLNAEKINTPVLIMHNKNDGDVNWEEGLELFLALRRLGKRSWMLQYDNGEHQLYHGNDGVDFTIRLKQFFDHYLKDSLPPRWMTRGIPAKMKGIDDGLKLDHEFETPPRGGLLTEEERANVDLLITKKAFPS